MGRGKIGAKYTVHNEHMRLSLMSHIKKEMVKRGWTTKEAASFFMTGTDRIEKIKQESAELVSTDYLVNLVSKLGHDVHLSMS